LPYQNEAIANKIEQIENVIGENNLTASRYPSDLIHALLCKHASSNVFKRKDKHEKKEIQVPVDHLKPGDAVQLKNQNKFNEANEWTILDVYDVSTGLIGEGKTLDGQLNRVQICLGILYVNESRKQLVLAHKSIQADWKSFFSSVGGLNNTLDGIIRNKIVPQLYACYEMTRKANKIAAELKCFLSFTIYFFLFTFLLFLLCYFVTL
jgi:hypothetical protein